MVTRTGIDEIKVSFPARRERETVHRTVSLKLVRFPNILRYDKSPPKREGFFMVNYGARNTNTMP